MKESELRVGHWYNWYAEGKHYQFQVEPKDFKDENYINFEPIPLTEEWLERLGFEDQSKALKTPDKTLNVSAIVDGYYYMYLDDVFGSIFDLERIQYVHQLQNLYFALTGEELKLKTDK